MKKLPSVHTGNNYQTLFKKMNTEYSNILDKENWDSIDEDIFDAEGDYVLEEGELIDEYLTPHGDFMVQGTPVLLYIRDQLARYYDSNNGYKYHILNCSTIQTMTRQGRKKRYVFKDPNFRHEKETPIFTVNIVEGDIITRTLKEPLKVCKNCLKDSPFNSYDVDNFDYKRYFDLKRPAQLARLNFLNFETAPVNMYPRKWPKISNRVKEKAQWRCQNSECGRDLSSARVFLHVHHKDHLKNNLATSNLIALCIECHSDQPGHDHLKYRPEYTSFMEYINGESDKFRIR